MKDRPSSDKNKSILESVPLTAKSKAFVVPGKGVMAISRGNTSVRVSALDLPSEIVCTSSTSKVSFTFQICSIPSDVADAKRISSSVSSFF